MWRSLCRFSTRSCKASLGRSDRRGACGFTGRIHGEDHCVATNAKPHQAIPSLGKCGAASPSQGNPESAFVKGNAVLVGVASHHGTVGVAERSADLGIGRNDAVQRRLPPIIRQAEQRMARLTRITRGQPGKAIDRRFRHADAPLRRPALPKAPLGRTCFHGRPS